MSKEINKYDSMTKTYEDQSLTKNEKLIYVYLILLYNNAKQYAYPSYASLKKALSTTRNDTVSKSIKSLEEKGYIKRFMESGKNTKYYLLKYISTTENEGSTKNEHSTKSESGTESEHSTSTKSEHQVVRKTNYNRINNKLNNRININSESSDDLDIENANKKKSSKKNNKNVDYDLLINEYTDNENLREALRDFAIMRKTIKKQMTERAFKIILNKLNTLTENEQIKILILEQSIMNNWQGIFPLKEQPIHVTEKPKGKIIDFKIGGE